MITYCIGTSSTGSTSPRRFFLHILHPRINIMASAVQEPSQAERFEGVAEANIAGPGATNPAQSSDPPREKHLESSSSSSSEAAAAQSAEGKSVAPQAPQRSAGKIALIMASLCVSKTDFASKLRVHSTEGGTDRRFLSSARHCKSPRSSLASHDLTSDRRLLPLPYLQSLKGSMPPKVITLGLARHIFLHLLHLYPPGESSVTYGEESQLY